MPGSDSGKLFMWESETLYTWLLIAPVASGVGCLEAE